nr:hypothetical protein K-LCC10_0317 [Kaumoebavirus]
MSATSIIKGILPEIFDYITKFLIEPVNPEDDFAGASIQVHNPWVRLSEVSHAWKAYFDNKIRILNFVSVKAPFPHRVPKLQIIRTPHIQTWPNRATSDEIYEAIQHSSFNFAATVYVSYPNLRVLCMDNDGYNLYGIPDHIRCCKNRPKRFFDGNTTLEMSKIDVLNQRGKSLMIYTGNGDCDLRNHQLCYLTLPISNQQITLPKELWSLSCPISSLIYNPSFVNCKIYNICFLDGMNFNENVMGAREVEAMKSSNRRQVMRYLPALREMLVVMIANGLQTICRMPVALIKDRLDEVLLNAATWKYRF